MTITNLKQSLQTNYSKLKSATNGMINHTYLFTA